MSQSSFAADDSGKDLLGRIITLLQSTDPVFVLVGIAVLVMLFFMAVFNRRNELFVVMITCTVLSGAVWPVVDAGSTLIRWYLLVLFCLMSYRLRANPGLSVCLYMGTIILGLIMTVFSHDFMWSVQNGVLMLVAVVAILVVTDSLDNREKVQRLLYGMLIPCLVWTVLGLWFLPEMERQAGRFSGFVGDGAASVFNFAGSALVPFAFWAMLQRGRLWFRAFCAAIVVGMMILMIVSTQRTGTYAAGIAFVPFLLRRRLWGVLFTGVIAGIIAMTLAWLSEYNPQQLEYASMRFGTTSTTGRYELWLLSLDECLESPFTGSGFGADRMLADGHRPHNWYLSTWFSTGVFGVVLTLAFMFVGILRGAKTTLLARDLEMSDLGALVCGQLLGRLAAGFFSTFNSPANCGTLIMILMLVLADRLVRIAAQEQQATNAWWNQYRRWASMASSWQAAPSRAP